MSTNVIYPSVDNNNCFAPVCAVERAGEIIDILCDKIMTTKFHTASIFIDRDDSDAYHCIHNGFCRALFLRGGTSAYPDIAIESYYTPDGMLFTMLPRIDVYFPGFYGPSRYITQPASAASFIRSVCDRIIDLEWDPRVGFTEALKTSARYGGHTVGHTVFDLIGDTTRVRVVSEAQAFKASHANVIRVVHDIAFKRDAVLSAGYSYCRGKCAEFGGDRDANIPPYYYRDGSYLQLSDTTWTLRGFGACTGGSIDFLAQPTAADAENMTSYLLNIISDVLSTDISGWRGESVIE